MITDQEKRSLLNAMLINLEHLQTTTNPPPHGMCAYVKSTNESLLCELPYSVYSRMKRFAEKQMETAFETWPEFSGSRMFPVPDPSYTPPSQGDAADQRLYRAIAAGEVYHRAVEGPEPGSSETASQVAERFWGGHPYGQARRRLLAHVIEHNRALLQQLQQQADLNSDETPT